MKKFLGLLIISLLLVSQAFAKDIRFVQVTDVNYQKGENSALEKVINDINKLRDVDFVVFTGDNIAKPTKENLKAFLSAAKKLKPKFYVVIGDRDVNKRKQLSKKDYLKYVHRHGKLYIPLTPNYVFEKNGCVFLVADGAKDVIPSRTGFYKDDVLEWLDANLDLYSDKPVVILQHFPVVAPAEKESYYTFRADKYLEVIAKHNNVKAIVAGHFGVNKEQKVNGVMHISTGGIPNYRVIDLIDYEKDTPTIWAEVKVAK